MNQALYPANDAGKDQNQKKGFVAPACLPAEQRRLALGFWPKPFHLPPSMHSQARIVIGPPLTCNILRKISAQSDFVARLVLAWPAAATHYFTIRNLKLAPVKVYA